MTGDTKREARLKSQRATWRRNRDKYNAQRRYKRYERNMNSGKVKWASRKMFTDSLKQTWQNKFFPDGEQTMTKDKQKAHRAALGKIRERVWHDARKYYDDELKQQRTWYEAELQRMSQQYDAQLRFLRDPPTGHFAAGGVTLSASAAASRSASGVGSLSSLLNTADSGRPLDTGTMIFDKFEEPCVLQRLNDPPMLAWRRGDGTLREMAIDEIMQLLKRLKEDE